MADNFQDNVSYGGSTLAVSGDAVAVGSTNNGAKSVIFNNSGSQGHLAWQPTANHTINLPDSNGTIQLTGQVPGAIAAGGQTATSGTVIFSNSNGLAFGLNNGTITGSYTVPSVAGLISAINVSGGTTSNNLSALTFSNANNVSFGLNGSTLTATATFAQTNQTVGLYAIGNTTQNSSTTLDARTLSFNGLGAASVGYSNGSIQVSVPVQTVQTQSNIQAIYDGANSISTGTIRYSNSNGISFGINGQTLTASHNGITSQTNQTEGLYAIGNTTGQSSSSTFDARTMSISGAGGVSVGYSGNALVISGGAGAGGNINISAGTTSNNLTNFILSNSNGVSFGLNGSTVTASHNGITSQTNQSVGLYALGNTTQNSSSTRDARSLSFNGLGALSIGYSNGSIQLSVPTQSLLSATGAVSLSTDGNTVSIGAAFNVSAGTTSNNLTAVTFSNSNGVSFGLNGSTVTASHNGITSQSNQTEGLYAVGNTTGQSSSTTRDARSISFQGAGGVSVGYSNGSLIISGGAGGGGNFNISAGTTSNNMTNVVFSNSNGVSFGLNGSTVTASAVGGGGIANAAGTQTATSGTVVFSNSNGISFGMSNSSIITASFNGTLNSVVFSNSNNVTFGSAGNTTITASFNQSNQTLGKYAIGNTTGQSSSSTFDARTMSISGAGGVSVGYSGNALVISGGGGGNVNFSAGTTSNNLSAVTFSNLNNISFGLNGSVITASVVPPSGAVISVSAGTTSNTYASLVFSNSNGFNFGLNGSTITAGHSPLMTYDVNPIISATGAIGLGTNTSAPAYFFPFIINEPVAAAFMNVAQSMSFITNGTSSGQQSVTISYGIYTRGTGANNSTLSVITSGSYPLFVTGNNSSYTIGQPTSTNSAGYTSSTTASAGVNISSGYTGGKLIVLPINSIFTPGQYWLGLFQRASTSSINVGISQSFLGIPIGSTLANLAPIGSFSSAYSTGTAGSISLGGNWHAILGSFTSAGQTNLPNTVAISALTNNLSVIPYMRLYSSQ